MGSPLSPRPAVRRSLAVARDHADRLDPATFPARLTSRPTSRSSAPASPGSGPPTTSPAPTPRCGSSCVEAEVAGFGASGRNGGWCSALFPTSLATGDAVVADAALAQHAPCARRSTRSGGSPPPRASTATSPRAAPSSLARSPPSCARAQAEVGDARAGARRRRCALDGRRDGDLARRRDASGATYTPRLRGDPPRPAGPRPRRGGRAPRRRPPRAARRRSRSSPGVVRTARGTVRADVRRAGHRGLHAPAARAAPRRGAGLLADHRDRAAAGRGLWDEIGLARRETFTDHRHLIIYGQRTADDRLVFGGRGAPYHFGSRIRPAYDRDPARLRRAARDAARPVPGAARRRFTHAWGGPLGHPARLVRLGRAGPGDRARVGGRVRRRRRLDDQPGRPDAARPGPRPRDRADRAAVGRPPLPPLGARAAALAGHQRRACGR